MEQNIRLSVLDIEKKYTTEINETSTDDSKPVLWGRSNDAPQLYLNCYRNSATLKSIIDGTANYIIGDGIEVNAEKWAEAVNKNGLTMRQFVYSLGMSYLTYGGFAFQVIYNALGNPVEVYPLDFRKCRVNESKTKVWYNKKSWGKYAKAGEEYDAFNLKNFNPKKPTQIFWWGGNFVTSTYPFPPFFGAISDVLTEIECSKYSLNTVSTGFAAKYVINFPENGNLTDEQKKGIEEAIKNKFSGAECDANFMLYWMNGGDGINVQKIESEDQAEKYIAIKDNARQNIFVSMRATPNLFGLPTATTGFNSQEFSDALKLFEKTVVDPIRDEIKEAIDKVTGIEDSITITPISISFNTEG